jgi:outer membrane protein OmpA-like peptidoglycan-associated protein
MKTQNFSIITIAVLVTALSSCSSTPKHNAALDQAQSQLKIAESNPEVTSLAADELTEAQNAVRMAQVAWDKKQESSKVNHLAYVGSQRVTIAQDTAASAASQAITANASAERDKLLLSVRTNEANQAEKRAIQSEERNRISADALAAAKMQATESTRQHEARVLALESELESLNAKQTERGIVVTLGDVLFSTGNAEISVNAAPTISKLAKFLNHYTEQHASIEGHTDSTGSEAGNYVLSQRRANAVQTALISLDVNRNQLTTQAYGQSVPIADNTTAVGRQLNRRVDIVFEQTSDLAADQE